MRSFTFQFSSLTPSFLGLRAWLACIEKTEQGRSAQTFLSDATAIPPQHVNGLQILQSHALFHLLSPKGQKISEILFTGHYTARYNELMARYSSLQAL